MLQFLAYLFAAGTTYGLSVLLRGWYGRPFRRLYAHLLGPVIGVVGVIALGVATVAYGIFYLGPDEGELHVEAIDPFKALLAMVSCFTLGWLSAAVVLSRKTGAGTRETRRTGDGTFEPTLAKPEA